MKNGAINALEEKAADIGNDLNGTKVTVLSGRMVYIDGHHGIESVEDAVVSIRRSRGRIVIRGSELMLKAMNKNEMIISGKVTDVSWE